MIIGMIFYCTAALACQHEELRRPTRVSCVEAVHQRIVELGAGFGYCKQR